MPCTLPSAQTAAALNEVAAGLGEPDDRGEPPGARRELLERLGGLRDERRLQQEVLGRVPGDRELRERDEVAARGVGLLVGLEDPRRVAGEVADDEIELGRGEAQPGHVPRIRGRLSRARHCSHDAPGCRPRRARRRSSPGAARPIRSRARAVLARILEAQPELAAELRDDRLVRDALDRDRVRLPVALRRARRTTRRWSSRCATPTAFNAERTVAARTGASLDGARASTIPTRCAHVEAARVPADRGARPARRRRPPDRRPRARGARRGVPRPRAASSPSPTARSR